MKTESFKLSNNILSLLEKNGITIATPIQEQIIPAVLAGRDVLAQSETGSGKTISFAIPIIEQIQTKDGLCALILVPTRELCAQVTTEFIKFSQGKRLGITAIYGGVSIENQINKIKKTNIIVATPGRLLDLIDRNIIHLNKIKYLVFDEADRMLDMGFIKDIEKILKHMSHTLQTMLFSATVSKEITELSKKYLYNPVHVILESSIDPEFLQQTYYQTTPDQKLPLLIHLLKQERDLSLVFCNRKHITSKLADKLTKYGIQAKCLHGNMSQSQRESVTSDFRNKKFNILIATDVASRGLHIEDITHVYNFEIPKDVDSYTHRVGRTARAGKKGNAISLVTNGEEQKFFKQILFNYRGNISLKTVNASVLPKIESQSQDKKKKTEKTQVMEEKNFPKNDKSKSQKTGHSEPYRGETQNSFIDNKPKKWSNNKPSYRGKRKSDSWSDTNSLVWSEKNVVSSDIMSTKSYTDDKSKFKRKNKPAFFGKKKSQSWEDRKPKFWTERKTKFKAK